VIGPDTSGNTKLEVRRFLLGEEFLGEVGRMEGRCDEDVGRLELGLEFGVGAFLVVRDDELVAFRLEVVLDAELGWEQMGGWMARR
jgi:hypothetical protein